MDDFAKLQLESGLTHDQWASEFAQQPPGRTASWNQIWDETAGPSNAWASEFGKAEAATVMAWVVLHGMLIKHYLYSLSAKHLPSICHVYELFILQAEARAGARAEQSGDALEQTKALADTLASDKDGKFANSRFLQFISKMSRGEIILEGNEVGPGEHMCIARFFTDLAFL